MAVAVVGLSLQLECNIFPFDSVPPLLFAGVFLCLLLVLRAGLPAEQASNLDVVARVSAMRENLPAYNGSCRSPYVLFSARLNKTTILRGSGLLWHDIS